MVNSVQLMGRIASDPKLFEYASGKKKICFPIAINSKNKKTVYIDCETWSETTIKYWQEHNIGKGWLLFIESGSLSRYRGKKEDGTYIDRVTVTVSRSFPLKSPYAKGETPLEAFSEEVDIGEEGFGDW